MMLRIEAGERSKRLDLNSVREETGRPVSTWTRMISFRIARLRVSRGVMGLAAGTLALCHESANHSKLAAPRPTLDSGAVAAVVDSTLTLAGPGRAGPRLPALLGRGRRTRSRRSSRARRSRETASRRPGSRGRRDRGAVAARIASTPRDLLVLAVPDDAIAPCAAALAGRLRCRVRVPPLGRSREPRPSRRCARAGAAVGSLHPLRPFTGAEGEGWRGALVAVEGDAGAPRSGESDRARARARGPTGSRPTAKPLYHAAASLAAGGTVAVVSVAVRACVAAGIPEEVAREALAGLASEATAAAAAALPFDRALTGAVARRDVGTVRAHARALAGPPDALALYRALAEEILRRTPGRGKEEEIRAIFARREPEARRRLAGRAALERSRNPLRCYNLRPSRDSRRRQKRAMVFFNYATMQMAAKVVYYGPGLCGKTTNLHHIYGRTAPGSRGEMVSLETETDRTLFFDLLPLDVGVIGGFKTRVQLYTVPGQVFYNTTRKLVLKGVDGIVFVADSQRAMKDANVESLANLRTNLAEIGDQARRDPAGPPVQQARPRQHPLGRGARAEPEPANARARPTRRAPCSARESSRRSRRSRG